MGTFLEVKGIVNLGRDPEVKYLQTGMAVCNFSGASTRNFKKNDEWEEETEWTNFVAWGKQAERIGEQLRKGSGVYVSGYLKTDKYDKEGQTHYATKCVVQKIEFLYNYDKPERDGGKSYPPATGSTNRKPKTDDDIPF